MIPIGGRPIISYVMESLRGNKISDIIIVVGYKKESIQDYLRDGESFSSHIEYLIQQRVAGTADAIRLAESHVENHPFLVLNGDQLIFFNSVEKVLDIHKTYPDDNVMGLVPVEHPENYGIASVEESRVKSILEKPSTKRLQGSLVNAGIYLFQPEIFSAIRMTKKSKRGEFEITDSLKSLIQRGSVRAVLIDPDSWIDIGRPWDLLEANERILKKCEHRIDGVVEEGARIVPPVTISKGARVNAGSVLIGPVFVGEGSELGPNCRIRNCTSIGRRVRIGPCCDIKNSIIMDGTKVPHLTYIGDSVIGEECNFGAGTNVANLRLDDATIKTPIRGRVVDSERRKLGIITGDAVRTGINASLMPGVKIGSGSWIGPGVILEKDVQGDTMVLVAQKHVQRKKRNVKQRSHTGH
jgi:bifunctional UDP-N-acetylglucosamine pyrophosphorylase/glucosamine-1-phosphate N-acetyltransferase